MDSGYSSSLSTHIYCMCAFSLRTMSIFIDFEIFILQLSSARIIFLNKNKTPENGNIH